MGTNISQAICENNHSYIKKYAKKIKKNSIYLRQAVMYNNLEITRLMLDIGATSDIETLELAVKNNNIEIFKLLIPNANANLKEVFDNIIKNTNSYNFAEILLNRYNYITDTNLRYVFSNNKDAFIDMFLKYDNNKITYLFYACEFGKTLLVKNLIKYYEPRVKYFENNTILITACKSNNIDIVNLILENGKCYINDWNFLGKRAIDYAVDVKNEQITLLLLLNGSVFDSNILIKVAKEYNWVDVLNYLNVKNSVTVTESIKVNYNVKKKCGICRGISTNNLIVYETKQCNICFEEKSKHLRFECGHLYCCVDCFKI